jgi:hypothetical protein
VALGDEELVIELDNEGKLIAIDGYTFDCTEAAILIRKRRTLTGRW